MEVVLPTCHICQGQMSRGLYEAAQWTCLRCWGGWLAGAPAVESAEGHAERLKERGARESAHPE